MLATALSFRLFGISLNHPLVRRSSRTASQIAVKLAHMEKWRDLGCAHLALDQPDWCTVLFILLYGLCKGDIEYIVSFAFGRGTSSHTTNQPSTLL